MLEHTRLNVVFDLRFLRQFVFDSSTVWEGASERKCGTHVLKHIQIKCFA